MFKALKKYFSLLTAFLILSAFNPVPRTSVQHPDSKQKIILQDKKITGSIIQNIKKNSLHFIPNNGQVNKQALFYANTSQYTLWLTKDGMVFDYKWSTNPEIELNDSSKTKSIKNTHQQELSKLCFQNANPSPELIGLDREEYRVNYFIGNDDSKWKSSIPTFSSVLYKEIYPHIDLKIYELEGEIEYDWIVKPGGKISDIEFQFEGTKKACLNDNKDLILETSFGEIKHKHPISYQKIEENKVLVRASFQPKEDSIYGFEVENYNKNIALIIDPTVLIFSTFLGGEHDDYIEDIAVDAEGAVYVTGFTQSINFPTKNPFQKYIKEYRGLRNIFITKINPNGKTLAFSTYLGGTSHDHGWSIAVDSAGCVYVAGESASLDFPLRNAYQSYMAGITDVIITKLKPEGNDLIYSTFLGGTKQDTAFGLAVDSKGAAYFTGRTWSRHFPIKNAFQKEKRGDEELTDAFITKLAPQGKKIDYSSYIGGKGFDVGMNIVLNSKRAAYIFGFTSSENFPTKKAFQKNFGGGNNDCFVCIVDNKGGGESKLIYSSYLGGSDNEPGYGKGITVDKKGAFYITGWTLSPDFPLKNPLQAKIKGGSDAFLTKFKPNGRNIVFSTYFGGKDDDRSFDIKVDDQGAVYITGTTFSRDFPTKNSFQKKLKGKSDVFVTKIAPDGKSLIGSSLFGGGKYERGDCLAIDTQGAAYIAGITNSINFPLKKAFQRKFKEPWEGFVLKVEIK